METTARLQLKKHMGFDGPSVDYTKIARILWGSVSGDSNRKAAAQGLAEYLKTTDLNFDAEEFTKVLTTGKGSLPKETKAPKKKKPENIFSLVKKGQKVTFEVPAGVYSANEVIYTIWKGQGRNYTHAWWIPAWDKEESWGPWAQDEAYTIKIIENLAAYYRK